MAEAPEVQTKVEIQNYRVKTGKSVAECLEGIASSGLSKRGEIVGLLNHQHGMRHGFANVAEHRFLSSDAEPKSEVRTCWRLYTQSPGCAAPRL